MASQDDPCTYDETPNALCAAHHRDEQLTGLWVTADRIHTGFVLGNYHHLMPRDAEAGRAFNRRVELRPSYWLRIFHGGGLTLASGTWRVAVRPSTTPSPPIPRTSTSQVAGSGVGLRDMLSTEKNMDGKIWPPNKAELGSAEPFIPPKSSVLNANDGEIMVLVESNFAKSTIRPSVFQSARRRCPNSVEACVPENEWRAYPRIRIATSSDEGDANGRARVDQHAPDRHDREAEHSPTKALTKTVELSTTEPKALGSRVMPVTVSATRSADPDASGVDPRIDDAGESPLQGFGGCASESAAPPTRPMTRVSCVPPTAKTFERSKPRARPRLS